MKLIDILNELNFKEDPFRWKHRIRKKTSSEKIDGYEFDAEGFDYVVMFRNPLGDNIVNVKFYANDDDTTLTNVGAIKVMSTVVTIIKSYLRSHPNIKFIHFTSAKTQTKSHASEQRAKLYLAVAKAHGFNSISKRGDTYIIKVGDWMGKLKKFSLKNETHSILEKVIGTVSDSIKVVIKLEKTAHAGERQERHYGEYIGEDEIKKTANGAVKAISGRLIFNKLDVGDFVHIHNTKTNLNLVGKLEAEGNVINLIIITVMKKKNFFAKPGTKTIRI